MNKHVRLLASLLGVALYISSQSCRSDKNDPASYDIESGCLYQDFTYVGSLTQAEAKIVKTEVGGYDILTDQPFLLDTTHYQLLNACNLPEQLKIEGKQVVISGKVYAPTGRTPMYLIIGQPFVLNKISSK